MSNTKEICEENLLRVYNRFDVAFDHEKGMYLYDEDGKDYLDMASGIGVMAIGHQDSEFIGRVEEQLHKLIHVSNLYYHKPMADAASKLAKASGMPKVFFTNSGAEAIEGALKTAKKYAYTKRGANQYEVIAMGHSFHGRTVGALSVTGTEHYREPFYPLMDGAKFAEFNNLESVKALVNDKTCAIILETVQGEGGLFPATKEFMQGIRKLCDEKDIIMIVDEIQCGMGRTGHMYAFMDYGITPDVLTTAKAVGGGLPIGAFCVSDKVAAASLVPGDHGTTYGGNPLCTAAVSAMLDIFESRQLVKHVQEITPYFEAALDKLAAKYDFITGRRGKGLMQGLVLTIPVGQVVAAGLKEGVVMLSAGADVLRLLPPLVITEADIDEFVVRVTKVLDTF